MPLDLKTANEVERLASIFDALQLEAHELAAAYVVRSKFVTPAMYRVAVSLMNRREADETIAQALGLEARLIAMIRELSGVPVARAARRQPAKRHRRHSRS